MRRSPLAAHLVVALLGTTSVAAQSFESNTTEIPQGSPGNNSDSENVAFADIDLDGDYDAIWADGGDSGNDRNRLWINQGGLQGGTVGIFVDDTGPRVPGGKDTSRDVDFADIDGDGDADIYVTNTSQASSQGSRFFINQGGQQGGTAGFFVDETSTRWVNIGVNGPTTSSSIPPSQKIVGGLFDGSFVTWSCDGVFGDLDNDGDLDLVHSSYGPTFTGIVPTRIFLNDGAGFFEEFNPSDFQLSGGAIGAGDPALWAEGLFQPGTTASNGSEADIAETPLGVELGDLDGDFDLDLLHGSRDTYPRVFSNRSSLNGGVLVALRDVTEVVLSEKATGGGNYEQELGDFDNDGDLDIYGLNWKGTFVDAVLRNDGAGSFGAFETLAGSTADENEADFFDYDNDGDLDVYVTNFAGNDLLHENSGAPAYTFTNVSASALPALGLMGLGSETADVDADGDTDVFVGNRSGSPNYYVKNLTNIPDTTAPRVALERIPDHLALAAPTRVRATILDNASWDKVQYASVVLEYTVNAGAPQTAAMVYAGGHNFSGTLPGMLVGTISYRVAATDDHGNLGVSQPKSFQSLAAAKYCTAGTSASGCQAVLSTTGTPSASSSSGFTLETAGVEGQKDGLYYFGVSGRQANAWGNGTSYQCVQPPVWRAGLLRGTGTPGACDGSFSQDLNARWTAKPASNPGAGAVVQAQLWYRDPQNTSNQTTSLSDAVEFTVQP